MIKNQADKLLKGNSRRLYILIAVMVLCGTSILVLSSLYKGLGETRYENRQEYLQQNLQKAIIEFKNGIEKYAILVSGLKSFIEEKGEMRKDHEVQDYLLGQLENIENGHTIIINYIDAKHNFIFSVDQKNLTSNDLVGTNVLDIRDTATVNALDRLLNTNGLFAFPPINLVEGFVGFPINFRVVFDEEVKGYIAPLIDMNHILDPVVQNDMKQEFTYRFSYGNDVLFDREEVYNGTKKHHSRLDTNNLSLSKDEYLFAEVESFSMPFTIGIAYRGKEESPINYFIKTSFLVILAFIVLSALLVHLFLKNLNKASDLKQSNHNLSFMNTILKKFIYTSSHDLKQPLVNINNFHSLVKEKYKYQIDKTGHKYLDVISYNIESMHAILDDLLVYSNIIEGKKVKEKIDLNRLINKLTESYSLKKIKIVCDRLPAVHGVSSEISRLFQNLISNAIKFNENEIPEIKISAEESGDSIIVKVSDNGIGIKEEYQSLIFEQFQRLNKHKYEGTGLGLAICKEIVHNHGGTIRAKTNETGGTDFLFDLKKEY